MEQLMKSIRDVAVFAWALVGINGTLATYGRGLPRGEAQPADGLPIWEPRPDMSIESQSSQRWLMTDEAKPASTRETRQSLADPYAHGLQAPPNNYTHTDPASWASDGQPRHAAYGGTFDQAHSLTAYGGTAHQPGGFQPATVPTQRPEGHRDPSPNDQSGFIAPTTQGGSSSSSSLQPDRFPWS